MTFTVLSLVASFVLSVFAGVIANYISKKIDEYKALDGCGVLL
ncbi:hypothetical protein [Staphylococcus pseudintermedius]|nr:hypothetical protein [Staphylococcus pseudintermedius]